MSQLFRDLAKRRPWPRCSEAKTSPVHHQPFSDCPPGKTSFAQFSDESGARHVPAANGVLCAVITPTGAADTTPRPLNPTPYYVDITVQGSTTPTRFSFSLKGY